MNALERRAAFSLAGIFSLRMLGLFMILPVFALYAEHLQGYTPVLAGLAIGAYGLTQAMLQIPFGLLSDRWGRKRVITLGLILFAAGSVVAALSDTMLGVILGRALQGSGAIAAAIMALTADLTRDEQRTKAMAVIGMSIGMAFAVALIVGPILNGFIGVPGIFWLTGGLALAGVAVLHLLVPNPVHSSLHRDAQPVPALFRQVLGNVELLRLDAGILLLHMILTGVFVVMPLVLRDQAGLAPSRHWLLYLVVLVLSVAAMVPFIIMAERQHRMKPVFLGAILVLGLALFGMAEFNQSLAAMAMLLFAYFTAFNLLEASLPSLVSKVAPLTGRGTAMGVYSSSQFLGAFLGGASGGWAHSHFGVEGVFLLGAGLTGLWLLVAAGMKRPRYLSSYLLHVGPVSEAEVADLNISLTSVRGVAEVSIVIEEQTAYLKVDRHALDEAALREFSAPAA